MNDSFATYTTSGKPAAVFDEAAVQRIRDELKSIPEPEGLVLLPAASGFDMYRLPASLLKRALFIASGIRMSEAPVYGEVKYNANSSGK